MVRTKKGVCFIELLGVQEQAFKKNLKTKFNKTVLRDDAAINDIRDALTGYFAGKTTFFHIPVDLSIGTQFQQRVWRKLKDIPYGEVRTYKWVAEGISLPKGVRAIGQACGSNPVPIIIPCHRVIRTDGSLGGFSSGIAIKEQLLKLEGII
ncbi:MAG: methylated-DNA--[protein]-cysteine S-methyltransferase [Candidatus Brocadiales bacterium]